jgi:hypothetical protein
MMPVKQARLCIVAACKNLRKVMSCRLSQLLACLPIASAQLLVAAPWLIDPLQFSGGGLQLPQHLSILDISGWCQGSLEASASRCDDGICNCQ